LHSNLLKKGQDVFPAKVTDTSIPASGTRRLLILKKTIALLEDGFGGIGTSSGMGAVNVVYMALLSAGGHLVSHNAVYGPARGIIESVWSRFGVESTYIDTSDLDQVKKAIRPNTKLIYLETPANPTIGISDIPPFVRLHTNIIFLSALITLFVVRTFRNHLIWEPI